MHVELLVARQAPVMQQQMKQRLKEIERTIARLERERGTLQQRLKHLAASKSKVGGKGSPALVQCPKCGRDRDFLTDNGGYLGHVLEDPQDVEALEPNKPLFCPQCGEVFLFQPGGGEKKR